MSAYEDTIKAGVRFKNQRSALFRAYNKNHKEEVELEGQVDTFVLKGLDLQITNYENERKRYQDEFNRLRRGHSEIKRVSNIPGIGDIGAVKIISRVVDANRFPTRNNFLSYCGLIKLERMSGGKNYGKKNSRYCRMMKSVFKSGALATIYGNNQFGVQYKYLINEKKHSERDARNAVARQIATVTYGVMKNKVKYNPIMNVTSRREKLNDISKDIDL